VTPALPRAARRSFRAVLAVCIVACTVGVSTATADPNFSYDPAGYDPANFRAQFENCVSGFTAADDLGATILQQLNGALVKIHYEAGGGATPDPSKGGNSTGMPVDVFWDPSLGGLYDDGAPKAPCAVLLHELEHAARFFTGQECTGQPLEENEPASQYDEALASRAENWWLFQNGRTPQRTTYSGVPLDQWTRWPASPANPVPPAPPCYHRCLGFNRAGCDAFHGGVYAGGDARMVASGNLKIEIGLFGYCALDPCEMPSPRPDGTSSYCSPACPHLDTAFPKGVAVTAIATPGPDSQFDSWGPGACHGQGATCTFTAQRPSCINARFLLTNPTAPPQSLPNVPCAEDP
jgi:hypothetical protein